MKQQQPIISIARYAIKMGGQFTGVIVHLVRSSDGVTTYRVTALNGRTSGCTCPSRKGCKHRAHVEQVEQIRREREAQRRRESPLQRGAFSMLKKAS